jgi:hypothetical protein
MLPTVQKFLGRVFAHREQECPSGKGSFPRKVNKTRKTGFLGTAAPTLHQHFQAEPSAAYLPQVVFQSRTLAEPTTMATSPTNHDPHHAYF